MLSSTCYVRFRTALVTIVCLLALSPGPMMLSAKEETKNDANHGKKKDPGKDKPDVDFDTLFQGLISGDRPVLTVAIANNRFILLLGASGGRLKPDDYYVFDQDSSTFNQTNVMLYESKFSKLSEKWPALVPLVCPNMFIVPDSQNGYIVTQQGSTITVFNMDSGKTSPLNLVTDGIQWFQQKHYLSSSDAFDFYSFKDAGINYIMIRNCNFTGPSLTQVDKFYSSSNFVYICPSGPSSVIGEHLCVNAVTWDIQAGFTTDQAFFLFTKSNSLISFSNSLFGNTENGDNGSSVPLIQIASDKFWLKFIPPTTTALPTTEPFLAASNATFIIIISFFVVFLLSGLVGGIFFIFRDELPTKPRRRRRSSSQQSLAKQKSSCKSSASQAGAGASGTGTAAAPKESGKTQATVLGKAGSSASIAARSSAGKGGADHGQGVSPLKKASSSKVAASPKKRHSSKKKKKTRTSSAKMSHKRSSTKARASSGKGSKKTRSKKNMKRSSSKRKPSSKSKTVMILPKRHSSFKYIRAGIPIPSYSKRLEEDAKMAA